MASINNTVQPGILNSTPSMVSKPPAPTYPAAVGGLTAPTLSAPSLNMAPSLPGGGSISGLVSPAHPAISAPSTSNISSHTYTTNPDGGTTTKITYAPSDSTGTGTSTTSTGGTGTTNGGATNPTPTPTPTPTPAPQTGNPYTAPLASTSTTGSAPAQQYTSQTANYGAGNISLGQSSQNIAQDYSQQIKDAIAPYIGLAKTQATTGLLPVAQGNELATLNAAGVLGQNLASAGNLALSGNQQALTAQNQAATASNEAAGQALGQQQTTQSGLYSAASLAQPSATSFGQTVFNPTTGQFTNNGGLPPDVMAQYAQMAANGQYSAIPSAITSNPVLSAQLNEQAKAINPNYNPIASTAQGTAQSQNITNLGTATTQGQAQVLSSIPQLTSAEAGAQSLQNNINALLQSNPQLNKSNAALANAAQQWLQGKQLGDPAYQTLFNYLQEYSNTLAPILGVGGDPTNMKTQIATSLINAQASGQSIMQVIQNLQDAAKSKISSLTSGAFGGGATNTNPSDPLGLGI